MLPDKPAVSRSALAGVLLAHGMLIAWLLQTGAIRAPDHHAVLAVELLPAAAAVLPRPRSEPPPRAPAAYRPATPQPAQQPIAGAAVAAVAPAEASAALDVPSAGVHSAAMPASASASTAPAATGAAAVQALGTPRYDVDYLDNPKPAYPALARRMGEEGRVVLRVQVSANGLPTDIVLQSASGSARLDQAAFDAVRRWRFVPARRGDEAVAASVLVPIVFSLNG